MSEIIYIVDGSNIIDQTVDFQKACRYYVKNRPQNENLRLMDEIPIEVIAAAYIADCRQRPPAQPVAGGEEVNNDNF